MGRVLHLGCWGVPQPPLLPQLAALPGASPPACAPAPHPPLKKAGRAKTGGSKCRMRRPGVSKSTGMNCWASCACTGGWGWGGGRPSKGWVPRRARGAARQARRVCTHGVS